MASRVRSDIARSILGILRKPLLWFVRAKILPENPARDLELRPDRPILYALRSDFPADIATLVDACRRKGLPSPRRHAREIRRGADAAILPLRKLGWIGPDRESDHEFVADMVDLIHWVKTRPDVDVDVVPVSILWGRDPGSDGLNLWHLLFTDQDTAGLWQKALVILTQGRFGLVNFDRPISLRSLVTEGRDEPRTAIKLRRLLRFTFVKQRTATLGPQLYNREQVITSIVETPLVRAAIEAEKKSRGIPHERGEELARRYADEIAADRTLAILRFLDILLTRLWNRIFRGLSIHNQDRLKEHAGKSEIVYVATHRSHLDSLVLGHAIFSMGYLPPHFAAGINMDFWPIGFFLRRAGAFFLRRSFGDNRIYKAVFHEYVHFLLARGHSILLYPEGGRSRTGRLLPPRTGMLANIVQSWLRNPTRRLVLIPVYLGYDKIPEVKGYFRELRGSKKKSESVRDLIQATHIIKSTWGKPYVSFGEPIAVSDFLNVRHAGWESDTGDDDRKPAWLQDAVNDLARESMTRMNAAAVVNASALFATVLHANPALAMSDENLLSVASRLVALMKACPYAPTVALPETVDHEWLRDCESHSRLQRFRHPVGDVMFLAQNDAILMSYYRNNILHLLALPSLIASFFHHAVEIETADLVEGVEELYPFLKAEFFLRWTLDEIPTEVARAIEAMRAQGLLVTGSSDSAVRRPVAPAPEAAQLHLLGVILGPVFERFAISAAMLAGNKGNTGLPRDEIENQFMLMAQRAALLAGANDYSVLDRGIFKSYVSELIQLGYLAETSDGLLDVSDTVDEIAGKSTRLLSPDLLESIARAPRFGRSV